MKRHCWTCVCLLVTLWATYPVGAAAAAEDLKLLWQIGKADNNTAEFALAPDRFGQFREDPLFIVGASDAKRDWPYVHPGPDDPWAGGGEHVFTILFAVKQRPQAGNCR
ncbi:MAG: polysaccharide lyase family protein, partial [Planctomycetota bacterium]